MKVFPNYLIFTYSLYIKLIVSLLDTPPSILSPFLLPCKKPLDYIPKACHQHPFSYLTGECVLIPRAYEQPPERWMFLMNAPIISSTKLAMKLYPLQIREGHMGMAVIGVSSI